MTKKNDNKLILVICEGNSDDITLHKSLQNYVGSKVKNLDVKVINGDLAYKEGINKNNCEEYLNKIIIEFIKKHHIFITDLKMIVHIIDTDCAFIEIDNIIEALDIGEYPIIKDEFYLTSKYDEIIIRFKNKKEIYENLAFKKEFRNVPYYVYYFSRNLEHAIHNKLSVSKKEKIELACLFDKTYNKDVDGFKKCLNDILFSIPNNYDESWNYILGNNSFKRCSNLVLLLHWFDENLKDK